MASYKPPDDLATYAEKVKKLFSDSRVTDALTAEDMRRIVAWKPGRSADDVKIAPSEPSGELHRRVYTGPGGKEYVGLVDEHGVLHVEVPVSAFERVTAWYEAESLGSIVFGSGSLTVTKTIFIDDEPIAAPYVYVIFSGVEAVTTYFMSEQTSFLSDCFSLASRVIFFVARAILEQSTIREDALRESISKLSKNARVIITPGDTVADLLIETWLRNTSQPDLVMLVTHADDARRDADFDLFGATLLVLAFTDTGEDD